MRNKMINRKIPTTIQSKKTMRNKVMVKRTTPTTQNKIMKIKAMANGVITTMQNDKTMTRPQGAE
jgi:hypothetical protein